MTERWDYGDEGRAYPVEPGQVWRCGSHWFMCSDLMASDAFDHWVAGADSGSIGRQVVVYSDPPWGQSLVNSFRTKAGLERAAYRWEDLYARIAKIGHSRGWPVYVEGSAMTSRDGRKIPATIEGGAYHHSVEITYYRTKPAGLYYCGPSPLHHSVLTRLAGEDDEHTPGIVMAYYGSGIYGPVGTVIDPCAGRGVTSREAARQGWMSLNNELNPLRVSAALSRMAAFLGGEFTPERVQ